jgi:hypothetical protein
LWKGLLDSPFLIAPFGILSRLLISFLLFLHCVIWPRKHFPVLSSFMTYRRILTRVTWMAPLVEQELFTLPEHPRSPPVFSRVRVDRSFVSFLLIIVLSVLWQMDADYSFGIGFHSFPVIDWFCLFIYLWVLTFHCKIVRSSLLNLKLFFLYNLNVAATYDVLIFAIKLISDCLKVQISMN